MLTPALLDTIRQTRVIVSHENCADGTVSAMLLKDALPNAKVVFVQHGTDALRDLRAEPHMLFCDIVPPAARVEEFVAAGAVVLDHHKTAKATVEAFGPNGIFADEAAEPGVSGAVLAYRVWSALTTGSPAFREWVEKFATLTGIRDTWQNKHESWAAAIEQAQVMFMLPQTAWMQNSLADLATSWTERYGWLGPVLVDRQAKGVQRSIKGGKRAESSKGTRAIIFNSLSNTSDAAEVLGREVDVIVGFSYEVENGTEKLIYSLRSHADFNCATFCKAHGGGGHTAAAGFSITDDGSAGPYQTFMRLLDAYEATR